MQFVTYRWHHIGEHQRYWWQDFDGDYARKASEFQQENHKEETVSVTDTSDLFMTDMRQLVTSYFWRKLTRRNCVTIVTCRIDHDHSLNTKTYTIHRGSGVYRRTVGQENVFPWRTFLLPIKERTTRNMFKLVTTLFILATRVLWNRGV